LKTSSGRYVMLGTRPGWPAERTITYGPALRTKRASAGEAFSGRRAIPYSVVMAVFCQQDEQAWRVLRQPARRVAQWRAQYHSDECVLILPNDDFGATALGAKRSVATKLCMLRVRTIALRRHDRERPIPCLKVTRFLSPLRLWSRHLGPEN